MSSPIAAMTSIATATDDAVDAMMTIAVCSKYSVNAANYIPSSRVLPLILKGPGFRYLQSP